MKEIKAYIRPERTDDVILALEKEGVTGMTVINACALAEWADPDKTAFSVKYVEKYCQVVKLELICHVNKEEVIINAICKAAYTGHPGNGKIFSSDIDKAVSIRTGARGKSAI
ncbi:MAG: P-II family nitrogen regulator [Candidatus Marinimicrobia bacterium]|nr:P-II family nitrogen regulator [Candidatus Neomarinimicrobiota bacterium]